VDHCHYGLEWVTMETVCNVFRSNNKHAEGTMRPAPAEEAMVRRPEWLWTWRRVRRAVRAWLQIMLRAKEKERRNSIVYRYKKGKQ